MSTGRLRSVKLAGVCEMKVWYVRWKSYFRLKFSTGRKRRAREPAVHPRCECNWETTGWKMLRQSNLWLKLWISRSPDHLSYALTRRARAVGAKVPRGPTGQASRGLRTCVPCRIHVTKSTFLLPESGARSGPSRAPWNIIARVCVCVCLSVCLLAP